jgi:prophage tail gpP-like protein
VAQYFPQAIVTLRLALDNGTPPLDLVGPQPLPKTYEFAICPMDVEVNINDYKTADKAKVSIGYDDFPFDPRTIKALGVTVHIEDMKGLVDEQGVRREIVASTKNVVFQGFADEESITFSDQERKVTLDCRDFTGLLIDARWPGRQIVLTETISVTIEKILKELIATQNIRLVKKPAELPDPEIGKFYPMINDPHHMAKADDSYWDVIQDLATHAGLICYMELDTLVLAQPQRLYDRSGAKQMIWGRNLKDLDFKRKLGRQRGLNVLVRSLSLETKTVLEKKYPKDAGIPEQTIDKMHPNGTVEKQPAPYHSFFVPSVSSETQLLAIAEKTWHELARQELEGNLKTNEMAVCDNQDNHFNLTKLRVGSAIELLMDINEVADEAGIEREPGAQNFNNLTKSEKIRYLERKNYPSKVAVALVDSLQKHKTTFYTKACTMRLNKEGWSLDVNFINFIELGTVLFKEKAK